MLTKAPQVTLIFWTIKILSTTVGDDRRTAVRDGVVRKVPGFEVERKTGGLSFEGGARQKDEYG
jgi:hypothetical protein